MPPTLTKPKLRTREKRRLALIYSYIFNEEEDLRGRFKAEIRDFPGYLSTRTKILPGIRERRGHEWTEGAVTICARTKRWRRRRNFMVDSIRISGQSSQSSPEQFCQAKWVYRKHKPADQKMNLRHKSKKFSVQCH